MSKMFFMHDAKIWNPFDTDYFMWLDAGISQTCYENYFYDVKILNRIREKIDPFLFLSYPYEATDEIHGFDSRAMDRYAGKKLIMFVGVAYLVHIKIFFLKLIAYTMPY